MRARVLTGFMAILLLSLGTTRADSQPEQRRSDHCFTNWSEAAQVVKQEKLVGVEQLSRQVQARMGGGVVKSTLCARGQRFLYRLIVRPRSGPLQSISVDAHQPFER